MDKTIIVSIKVYVVVFFFIFKSFSCRFAPVPVAPVAQLQHEIVIAECAYTKLKADLFVVMVFETSVVGFLLL